MYVCESAREMTETMCNSISEASNAETSCKFHDMYQKLAFDVFEKPKTLNGMDCKFCATRWEPRMAMNYSKIKRIG